MSSAVSQYQSQYSLISEQLQHQILTPDTLQNLGNFAGSFENSFSMEMSKCVQEIPDDVLLAACMHSPHICRPASGMLTKA